MRLIVNGKSYEVDAEPDMPLLWVLRDELGITGPKYGCGIAQCGACTVQIVGGTAMRSCQVLAGNVGAEVTTIEGLGRSDALHAVQAAWIGHQVAQFGYCQSGQECPPLGMAVISAFPVLCAFWPASVPARLTTADQFRC